MGDGTPHHAGAAPTRRHPVRRRVAAALALPALAVGAGPTTALAHTDLVSSYPAAGQELGSVPDQVTLEFASPLVLTGEGIVVRGPDGEAVDADVLGSASGDVFVAVLETDADEGTWHIDYAGMSTDGHRVVGGFSFLAGGGTGATGATAPVRPTGPPVTGVAVLLVVLAVGFVVVVRDLVPPAAPR